MARDIEEFLRRAAERRQQQKAGGAAQPQQPQQPQPRQPPRQMPPQKPMVIEDVEIVESKPARRPIESKIKSKIKANPNLSSIRSGSVADHVKSHIDTSKIAEHAEHLGDRIAGVHEEVESRISSRLDRDISVIDDKPTVTDDAPAAIFGAASKDKALALRALLSNPTAVGQAIVMAEILKRPDFED
jgi:hypothetical protein